MITIPFSLLFISSCSRVQESINLSKNITEHTKNMPQNGLLVTWWGSKPWNKDYETILGTCFVLWRNIWEAFSYNLLFCDKWAICFLPNTASYLYFSVLHFLNCHHVTLLPLAANDVPDQIWVLKRGRGRSPKTFASPWTLLARALMDAAMSIGSWGSCIKERARN